MARPDFLTELRTATKATRKFFSPAGKKWLTAVLVGRKDDDDAKALDVDRIYELFCYFSLLSVLATTTGLELKCILGAGPGGYRFPYSPGDKQNFAFFRLAFEGKAYDLCCGTGVPSLEGGATLEHPDLTLQLVAGKDAPPIPGEVVAIWDAKYHAGEELSKGDIAQMKMWSWLLELTPCKSGDVIERMCPPAFQVNAIVTNAKKAPTYSKMLLDGHFSIVLGFEQAIHVGLSSRPSRTEHVAYNVAKHKPPAQLPVAQPKPASSV